MRIIRIEPDEYGSHQDQTINIPIRVPEGWALIPPGFGTPVTLENYPFGEVTVEDQDGVPTVTGWTPLPIQEPEVPTEREYTTEEMIRALLGQ